MLGALISIVKASLRAVFRGGSFVDGCGTAAQSVPWRCLRLFAAGGLLLAAMAKNSSRCTPRAYALARCDGHLELWNRNMTACRHRILPSLGRMRRSLALYYFTAGCPKQDCLGDCDDSHSTLWQTPKGCQACQEPACKAYK
ncbi:hypothetical protein EMIHUDRAFT_211214 [Emiliania huxleyi CCMP1516]|uniref:Uncharacterized protein n=2 Tax=Emiliania huxleyi TaxID=2903 RepID=A0A0D3IWM5_EMIH1|nr:hypothetical protein EMIHUDRAFT_211214 [Emiliania huxleyi CCMP1516]EOD15660.1 hypothetical protein EMIHUDRAFT_211214 [Emiliania huxleyi CCMP1516]|eukprot:XP_005768089.1 hypothetical protein EMIHUDRAFT_211214 [Emiliania huxleyi CCMP1516]